MLVVVVVVVRYLRAVYLPSITSRRASAYQPSCSPHYWKDMIGPVSPEPLCRQATHKTEPSAPPGPRLRFFRAHAPGEEVDELVVAPKRTREDAGTGVVAPPGARSHSMRSMGPRGPGARNAAARAEAAPPDEALRDAEDEAERAAPVHVPPRRAPGGARRAGEGAGESPRHRAGVWRGGGIIAPEGVGSRPLRCGAVGVGPRPGSLGGGATRCTPTELAWSHPWTWLLCRCGLATGLTGHRPPVGLSGLRHRRCVLGYSARDADKEYSSV